LAAIEKAGGRRQLAAEKDAQIAKMPGVEKPLPEVGNGHATAAPVAAVHIALCCRVVQFPRLSAHENIGGSQLAVVEVTLVNDTLNHAENNA
jgi:hypothetical protein